MVHLFVAPPGPEIPDEKAHRIVGCRNLAVRPALAWRVGHQPPIGPARVGIRDNNVRFEALSPGEFDTADPAVFCQDRRNFGIASNLTAIGFQHAHQPLHQRAHSAIGIMDTKLPLQMRNQAVISGGRERVSADKQGMIAEHGPEMGMPEISRHHSVDGPVSFQPHKVCHRRCCEGDRMKRLVCQGLKGDCIDASTFLKEPLVAVDILR